VHFHTGTETIEQEHLAVIRALGEKVQPKEHTKIWRSLLAHDKSLAKCIKEETGWDEEQTLARIQPLWQKLSAHAHGAFQHADDRIDIVVRGGG